MAMMLKHQLTTFRKASIQLPLEADLDSGEADLSGGEADLERGKADLKRGETCLERGRTSGT